MVLDPSALVEYPPAPGLLVVGSGGDGEHVTDSQTVLRPVGIYSGDRDHQSQSSLFISEGKAPAWLTAAERHQLGEDLECVWERVDSHIGLQNKDLGKVTTPNGASLERVSHGRLDLGSE